MLSTSAAWSFLSEQLRQLDEIHQPSPSAPVQKVSSVMTNTIRDAHWIEFDTELFLPLHPSIGIDFIKQSVVITHLTEENQLLKLFDVILTLNEIELKNQRKDIIQCLIDAHQGKRVAMRIRRLQPSKTEMIQFDLEKSHRFQSKKLGFTIDTKSDSINDPGLFVIGIHRDGPAAQHGRLRVGDRLLQISNRYVTVNLQCMELDKALKLIQRMKKESNVIQLLIAHRYES